MQRHCVNLLCRQNFTVSDVGVTGCTDLCQQKSPDKLNSTLPALVADKVAENQIFVRGKERWRRLVSHFKQQQHCSQAAFEDPLYDRSVTFLSHFKGSFKCVGQMLPFFPTEVSPVGSFFAHSITRLISLKHAALTQSLSITCLNAKKWVSVQFSGQL